MLTEEDVEPRKITTNKRSRVYIELFYNPLKILDIPVYGRNVENTTVDNLMYILYIDF